MDETKNVNSLPKVSFTGGSVPGQEEDIGKTALADRLLKKKLANTNFSASKKILSFDLYHEHRTVLKEVN